MCRYAADKDQSLDEHASPVFRRFLNVGGARFTEDADPELDPSFYLRNRSKPLRQRKRLILNRYCGFHPNQDPNFLMTFSVTVCSRCQKVSESIPPPMRRRSRPPERRAVPDGGDSFVCRPDRAFSQLKVHLCPPPPQPLFSLQSFNDWRICR